MSRPIRRQTVLYKVNVCRPFESLGEVVCMIERRGFVNVCELEFLSEALPQQRRRPPEEKNKQKTSTSLRDKKHI